MKITALEIAEKHNGTVEGDENILLTSLAKIQDAKKTVQDELEPVLGETKTIGKRCVS